ncbi:hypothetical protein WT77_26145 [Burkholderia stagnalis]|nr:hypothetical protein WT18_09070 [Burkholderia stagnalis]KVW96483.1 hypothetical protein WT30_11840 [Burkholderia stagnalis]KWH75606.1 hypothetical protein WT66_02070 [Burkholderia stagnalis]KWK18959.1 hypothetical protein WT77_26145 [Burkholderia stagnalis]KWK48385.1 hypothetical protein WT81_31690 [Burkholderia stagnalis]
MEGFMQKNETLNIGQENSDLSISINSHGETTIVYEAKQATFNDRAAVRDLAGAIASRLGLETYEDGTQLGGSESARVRAFDSYPERARITANKICLDHKLGPAKGAKVKVNKI